MRMKSIKFFGILIYWRIPLPALDQMPSGTRPSVHWQGKKNLSFSGFFIDGGYIYIPHIYIYIHIYYCWRTSKSCRTCRWRCWCSWTVPKDLEGKLGFGNWGRIETIQTTEFTLRSTSTEKSLETWRELQPHRSTSWWEKLLRDKRIIV